MSPSEVCSQSNRSELGINNRLERCGLTMREDLFQIPSNLEAGKGEIPVRPAVEQMQTGARRKIEMAVAYMLQHLDEPLEMSTVSRWTGISPSTFYYLFKRATGYTPNDFFIRARMRRACELLSDSDLNIKEVASLLGYQDQFYFSRLFKAVTGLAPRAYRAKRDYMQDAGPENVPILQDYNSSFRLCSNQKSKHVSVLNKKPFGS